jgi:hypothetical protein
MISVGRRLAVVAVAWTLAATPVAAASIDLQVSGPAAGVELCVAGVELRSLSAH